MLVTGDITLVVATSEPLGPVMQHRAVLFEYEGTKYILHQTFSGPELITWDKFIKKRTILFTRRYKLKKELPVEDVLMWNEYQRFNLIFYNCENFCNDIIDRYTTTRHTHMSQQILFWTVIVVLSIIKTSN